MARPKKQVYEYVEKQDDATSIQMPAYQLNILSACIIDFYFKYVSTPSFAEMLEKKKEELYAKGILKKIIKAMTKIFFTYLK